MSYHRIEKKYLSFLKSQEILSEPFRNKVSQLNNFFLPISQRIYKKFIRSKKPIIIGLTGGQGSGKSTISNILKIILKEGFNLKTVIFSIDDFYKTLKDRKKMTTGLTVLQATDIAECILFAIKAPAHVNISMIEVTPTEQSPGGVVIKKLKN